MEEDCFNTLDEFFTEEARNLLFCSTWTRGSYGDNMAVGDDAEDIQALFNGEVNPETENNDDDDDDTSLESESEMWSPRKSKEISDEEIKNLRVKELNKLLRNIPLDEAAKIRRRRRNLKNRGYALTCRQRKQQEHETLINENTSLKKELEEGKRKLLKVLNEKEEYKKKYLQAQQALNVYKRRMETSVMLPCR